MNFSAFGVLWRASGSGNIKTLNFISVNGVNVLGEVVNYGSDCQPPDVPPCVGSACTPPPPPPPSCEVLGTCPPPPPPTYSCMDPGVVTHITVQNGVATFTVTPGHTVDVSFVGFIKDGVHSRPQTFHEMQSGTFHPGTYTLTVTPQLPYHQEDLFCDLYPAGQDLTDENSVYWDTRVLWFEQYGFTGVAQP